MFAQQFCHRLFLIGFAQSKNVYALAVPPNTVPNPVFIAILILNAAIEAWCLNLAQDSINVLSHGELVRGWYR